MIWVAALAWFAGALPPLVAVRVGAERIGFVSERWPDVLGACVDAMMAGEARAIPIIASLVVPPLVLGLPLLVGGARAVRRSYRLGRMVVHRSATPPRRLLVLARRAGLARPPVHLDDARAYAFAYGWWRPRTAVSCGLLALLTDDEVTAVLRHEAHHARCGGPIRHAVLDVLGDAFRYWPRGRELVDSARLDEELAADRAACCADDDAAALLSALLKLARLGSSPCLGAPTMSCWLEARVRAVCDARGAELAQAQVGSWLPWPLRRCCRRRYSRTRPSGVCPPLTSAPQYRLDRPRPAKRSVSRLPACLRPARPAPAWQRVAPSRCASRRAPCGATGVRSRSRRSTPP